MKPAHLFNLLEKIKNEFKPMLDRSDTKGRSWVLLKNCLHPQYSNRLPGHAEYKTQFVAFEFEPTSCWNDSEKQKQKYF